MNPTNELEKMIERALGMDALEGAPVGLRSQIESRVRAKIRWQTRIDDFKWLGLTFGILAFVLIGQWALLRGAHDRLENFCQTEIASPETGEILLAILNASDSKMANPGIHPESK